MKTEDLSLDDCCHGNEVEESGKHGPNILASKLLLTLIIEAIDLSYSA